MAVGTANGLRFTESDLDAIITAFDALNLRERVPLKFGHGETEQDQPFREGMPALGWVSRIYRDGKKLLADFTNIPTAVFEAIKTGLYRFVSVELLKDVQAGTRSLPWVLDAVALLGADQPAFGNLKDLQALTLKRGPALRASARVAFTRDRKLFSTGDRPTMTPEEIQKVVSDAIAAERATFTRAQADAKAAFEAELKKRDEQLHTQRVEFHRSQIKAKFEAAVTEGVLLPAKREQLYKFAKVDTDAVLDIKAEDVDAYIKDNAEKTTLTRKPTSGTGTDEKAEEGLRADQVVDLRAKKLCYSRNQDPTKHDVYLAAVKEVLSSDAKVGESYKYMPDTEYRHAS